MRTFNYTLILTILSAVFLLTSCYYEVTNTSTSYGPPGRNGVAYFGIDYDFGNLYSYWDNNPSIPENPIIGQYYYTYPGVYEFEYFINEFEYWYGTYEVFINLGGPGRPHNQPGFDGRDTYLLLICNPNGPYEERASNKKATSTNEPIVIEKNEENHRYRIVMQKTTIQERQPHGKVNAREL